MARKFLYFVTAMIVLAIAALLAYRLFGTDMITLTLKGTANGDMVDFEGEALQLPGVNFKAFLTRIAD